MTDKKRINRIESLCTVCLIYIPNPHAKSRPLNSPGVLAGMCVVCPNMRPPAQTPVVFSSKSPDSSKTPWSPGARCALTGQSAPGPGQHFLSHLWKLEPVTTQMPWGA